MNFGSHHLKNLRKPSVFVNNVSHGNQEIKKLIFFTTLRLFINMAFFSFLYNFFKVDCYGFFLKKNIKQ